MRKLIGLLFRPLCIVIMHRFIVHPCTYSGERVSNDALPTSQSLSTQHPGSADVPLSQCLPLSRPWTSSSLYRRRQHVQKQMLSARRRVRRQSTPACTTSRTVPRCCWQEVVRCQSSSYATAASSEAEAEAARRICGASGPWISGVPPSSSQRSNSETSTPLQSRGSLVRTITHWRIILKYFSLYTPHRFAPFQSITYLNPILLECLQGYRSMSSSFKVFLSSSIR